MISQFYSFAFLLVILSTGMCADQSEKESSVNTFDEIKDFSVNLFDEATLQQAEVIGGCKIGSSDCGTDSNATCAYSVRLKKAYCKCNDSKERFDYDAKKCVDCDCGSSAIDCEIKNKKKSCICPDDYFYNGGKCKACKCGSHSSGCEASSNGDKICFCEPMYKQRFDECSYCDCGYHEGNCSFTRYGEKTCSCEPGFTMDSYEGICAEMCNNTKPCQNEGTCYKGVCKCSEDYTGSWCETPTFCANGKCGYKSDVECVWNRILRKGECRCKKDNYYYLPKDRECQECKCGDHGSCILADNALMCKCDKNYAWKLSECERCDCGPWSEKCTFNSRGDKKCQCPKGYASKTTSFSILGTWCEICDCGEHGRCYWDGRDKICDCEDGYRSFEGKCRDCSCGKHGTCQLDESGDKVCTCDYGFAEHNGFCIRCDCNFQSNRRNIEIQCTFVNGSKQCLCPPGFESGSVYCEDINECYTIYPCPDNTICVNKPGTYECKCKVGFKSIHHEDPKLSGCEDIDECSEFPCQSQMTRCVNSVGSFDCVCREGYYSTSSNFGSSYKPAHNNCYEIKTQWREATIALGVIFSIGIIGITSYIRKHKRSS